MKAIRDTRFTEYRLDAAEKPRAMYEYYVSGTGAFPLDMLRHDSVWPASGEDAAKMDWDWLKLRSIKLRSYREPTLGRWHSFGWSVGTQKLGE